MLKKDDRGAGDRRGISAWCHRGSADEDDDRAGCDREGQYHEKRVALNGGRLKRTATRRDRIGGLEGGPRCRWSRGSRKVSPATHQHCAARF
jgi:hypothetical protein